MTNKILSTKVSVDQTSPVQPKGKRPYIRERGFADVMTEREAKIIAAQRYRPSFAAEIRVLSRQELASLVTYSR
jgi:hypothetical protein